MKKPEEILKTWLQLVNNADIEKLLALYNKEAILIPTFSNRILNTPEKIRNYFEVLGRREELCVALHEKTVSVQKITENLQSISGIYCWRFAIDEELLSFEARFSYLVDLLAESPILHHHSSQIPRML